MPDGLDQLDQARRQRSERASRIPPSRKKPRATPVNLTADEPVVAKPATPEPAPAEPTTSAEPAAANRPEPAAAATAKQQDTGPAKQWRHKVSFYQDRDDTNQVRAAILYTQAQEGPRSMSEFIQTAVMNEVRRLQDKYNGGEPFAPVEANDYPKGTTIRPR